MMGLQVLPLDIQHIEAGVVADAVATSLYIQVPDTLDTHAANKNARKRWWEAFQQCYLFTLRSLSFPTHSGRYLTKGPNSSLGQDGERQSVISILSSGQPLAKSPSVLILDARTENDTPSAERQERTWWAQRFHDVLHDVQHSDSFTPILQKMSGRTCHPHRKTINGKRQLKLSGSNG